jgi:hypothetical protein
MILINLLYRRFDNLLRTISEIVTRGIVLAIREREKQVVSIEINNDKVAGTVRSIRRSSSSPRQFRLKISLIRCTMQKKSFRRRLAEDSPETKLTLHWVAGGKRRLP